MVHYFEQEQQGIAVGPGNVQFMCIRQVSLHAAAAAAADAADVAAAADAAVAADAAAAAADAAIY